MPISATNVISITDGQIFLAMVSSMGIRPAIDAGSSVVTYGWFCTNQSHEKRLLVHFVSTLLHTVSWKPSLSLVLTWTRQHRLS